MLKKEFVNVVHENLKGYNKKQCETFVNTVLDSITQVLISGEELKLTNFGTFKAKVVKAHDGVHPVTHDPIRFQTKVTPHLKFSNKVKESVAFANKQ